MRTGPSINLCQHTPQERTLRPAAGQVEPALDSSRALLLGPFRYRIFDIPAESEAMNGTREYLDMIRGLLLGHNTFRFLAELLGKRYIVLL